MLGPRENSANRISPASPLVAHGFILIHDKVFLPLKSGDGEHLFDDPTRVRKLLILDMVRIDRRSIDAAHAFHRGVEMVKCVLLDQGRDLGGHPIEGLGLIDENSPVRLHDRFYDRILVERPDRPEVEDLRRYTM